jgi:hypothetical protein
VISDEERIKRQQAYENAKAKSIERGVELTPETEALMKQYINGEIGQEAFFGEIRKVVGQAFGAPTKLH